MWDGGERGTGNEGKHILTLHSNRSLLCCILLLHVVKWGRFWTFEGVPALLSAVSIIKASTWCTPRSAGVGSLDKLGVDFGVCSNPGWKVEKNIHFRSK